MGTTVIYADILVLLNLYISFFLIWTTSALLSRKLGFWRQLAGAAAGAVSSLYIFVPVGNEILSSLVKLAFSVVIVLAAFGFGGLKNFLRTLAVFYASTFIFAGIMMGIWLAFRPSGMVINNSVVYFGISPLTLIVSTAVCYGVMAVIRRISGRIRNTGKQHTVCITYKGRSVEMNALVDTGNSLRDVFSDKPVIIVDKAAARSVLPAAAVPAFVGGGLPDESMQLNYRLVPYSVVGGSGLIPCFKPDRVLVDGNQVGALIGVSEQPLGGGYSAIISTELL